MVEDNHTLSPPGGQLATDTANDRWASGRIDRLVTSELDEADRLDLLAWLDAEPTRWRQCGLAFLEAQALRESLAPGAGDVGVAASSAARPPYALPASRPMIIAAAVATIAFVLGWALGHRAPTPADNSGMVAADGSPRESSATSPVVSAGTPSVAPVRISAPVGRVTLVRVRVGEGANARELVLPVLGGTAGDASWERTPGPVPDYVRRQWERQGYRVTERRQTVPFKLADGRQIDLPVEQVMLTFVGQPVL